MKKLIRYLISHTSVGNKRNLKIFQLVSKLKNNISANRQKQFYQIQETSLTGNLFSDKTVLNGPFKGLQYPDLYSAGSTLFPKLIGSYESELHTVIYDVLKKDYKQFIDVGCAEGYYAVGFALKLSGSVVHAFDINADAINKCRQMAELNDVNERVFTYAKCNANILSSFDFSKKTFILIDCEGFEKKLFNAENILSFRKTDLLIEVHDFVDDSISSYLLLLFKKTHNISIITSISDFQKPFVSNYSGFADLSLITKYSLLQEKRPEQMQWFLLKSVI